MAKKGMKIEKVKFMSSISRANETLSVMFWPWRSNPKLSTRRRGTNGEGPLTIFSTRKMVS